jgi:hypothetical protein
MHIDCRKFIQKCVLALVHACQHLGVCLTWVSDAQPHPAPLKLQPLSYLLHIAVTASGLEQATKAMLKGWNDSQTTGVHLEPYAICEPS